ncbi:MAG: family 78 glycoside hydrolase catalytic domain [Paraprevotella sp.]|nr:family 78 glycoside hydrolase catalytic domain [Paraprevotella sp.]
MWQINLEAGYPRFRPHSWRNGTASCLAELDLRPFIAVERNKSYRLRIEVEGKIAKTYINNILVDTRTNPYGENFCYGKFGIREDRAQFNYNDLEKAYFDNFTVKNLENDETLITETFESSENPFTQGTINNGRLYVVTTYAWYSPKNTCAYDIELDFIIERDNAGIIFSAYDSNNMHLWGINIKEKSYPFLRRHIRVNGTFSYSDVSLSSFLTKEQLKNSKHHLKSTVRSGVIQTYIDDKLVDTYNDHSANLHNGLLGFRAYHDTGIHEKAYYDNIQITTFSTDTEEGGAITFSENFEGAGHPFSDGTITVKEGNKMLGVSSTFEENCVMQTGGEKGIPMFRNTFTTKSNIKTAQFYASALGVFDLFVNGHRVGQKQTDGSIIYDELKPGWTDYRKEVNYLTYDVTDLIKEGQNAIGAQVSNGWWSGAIARGVYGNHSPGFIGLLRITYHDGEVENIVTDTNWQCSFYGPVIMGEIYDGETYDARRESQWSTAEYDASDWCKTIEHNGFKGEITALLGEPVRVREQLRRIPQSITVYDGVKNTGTAFGMINIVRTQGGTETLQLKAGETAIYDLGQNISGWIRFTVKGESGTRLRFKFGEMLNDLGDANRADDGPGGSLYTYNLRNAGATLTYTLKGASEGETFQPSNSFFGFRYCEVTTTSDVDITQLTGEVVGSDIEEVGTFKTSHADVNQLYSNILWGQRGNFLSIPTDCPQRDERLGWTGDTQVYARTACYNAYTRAFYHKWMTDLRNSQREDGAYPEIAPFCNFWGYGTAGWADAGIIVPWTVYQMYGDKKMLEENYESMTKYMNWLSTQSFDGYLYNGAGTATGDWLSYETTDSRFVSVCYYAYVAQLMSKIAKAISHTEADKYYLDAKKYEELYDNIKAEFQKRYIDQAGFLTISTQASYLMALNFGLMPDESIQKSINMLRIKLTNNGYKLSTGFLGTSILNQTLSKIGLNDMAYHLLLQRENPSWLYSVDQGATTIWERWDSYTKEGGFNKHEWNMNSFNHYAYGVVAEWMFRYIGGIETDEEAPGFKHFILQPQPDTRKQFPEGQVRITSAKATHLSGYGFIGSEWQYKENGRIRYTATVPANTSATLYLPLLNETDIVLENGQALEKVEGLTFKGIENQKAIIELQSGTYNFDVEEGEDIHVEQPHLQTFNVYPNPCQDVLHLKSDEDIIHTIVVNSDGKVIHSQNHGNSINTSSWQTGLYILNITTKANKQTTKVIKKQNTL